MVDILETGEKVRGDKIRNLIRYNFWPGRTDCDGERRMGELYFFCRHGCAVAYTIYRSAIATIMIIPSIHINTSRIRHSDPLANWYLLILLLLKIDCNEVFSFSPSTKYSG